MMNPSRELSLFGQELSLFRQIQILKSTRHKFFFQKLNPHQATGSFL